MKIIFRKWKTKHNPSCIALFPEMPGDTDGNLCQSYEHFGQHSAADYATVINKTRPAIPKEYGPLLLELIGIGYKNIQICQKADRRMFLARQKEAQRIKDLVQNNA